ncbi:MAG: SDR family oxidoreductase, partial [Gammaproteobacteria bacterium]|nr:SDR family oxidoreductase [Gammaproteobacteria bacterium]
RNVESIILVDLDELNNTKLSNEVGGIPYKADVGSEDDIIKLVEFAKQEMGGIDIFCSNAGISGAGGLLNTSNEDWSNIWNVNVMSHIHAAKHTLPIMLEQGSGYFMNTASAAGLLTQLGAAGYSVTKSAAVSFAEWLKITYGERGIGVSCLCPQGVRTPMVEDAPEIVGSLVSIDGLLEPDVVANEVIECIEKDQFLITPHPEVLEYMKIKASDPDRWINGMQSLATQLIEGFPEAKAMLRDLDKEEELS